MVELFDAVANEKMFEIGTLSFGGMLASKTKNKKSNKYQQQQQQNGGGGGSADVNSLHLLIDCKNSSHTLSGNCLNNNLLNDTQTYFLNGQKY